MKTSMPTTYDLLTIPIAVCTPTWRLECHWTDWLDDENGAEISPNDWGEFELIDEHRIYDPSICEAPRDIEV